MQSVTAAPRVYPWLLRVKPVNPGGIPLAVAWSLQACLSVFHSTFPASFHPSSYQLPPCLRAYPIAKQSSL